jgi:hypothetical protein
MRGHRIEWFIPNQVVYCQLPPQVSLDTFANLHRELVHYLNKGIDGLQILRPIHVIVDAREVETFPLNVLVLRRTTIAFYHPAFGWMLTLTDQPALKWVSHIVPQMLTQTRTQVFSEMRDVIAFLQRRDKTLAWEQAEYIHTFPYFAE